MVNFPYYSHFRIPKDMGMVWVPLTIRGFMSLGVPGKSPLKICSFFSLKLELELCDLGLQVLQLVFVGV